MTIPYYPGQTTTPQLGISLVGMDESIAEGFILVDAQFGGGGGSTSVLVNGSPITNPNFNDTTPAAPPGNTNVTWQVSGSNVSAYVPTGGGSGNISGTLTPGVIPVATGVNAIGDGSLTDDGIGNIGITPAAMSFGGLNIEVASGLIHLHATDGDIEIHTHSSGDIFMASAEDVFISSLAGEVTLTSGTDIKFDATSGQIVTTALGISASKPLFTDSVKALVSGSVTGNTTVLASSTGVLTAGHVATWDANGNIIDGGTTPGGTGVPSVILWVDGNRTDTYTADGTILTPFKTITAAINQIIANADNATVLYMLDIAPGTYQETIDLSNTALVQLMFEGHGRSGTVSAEGSVLNVPGVTVGPVSGNAVTCTSNNNQLEMVQFSGITFVKPVNFTNPTNLGNLGLDGIFFSDCHFATSSGPHVFNNVQVVSLVLSAIGNSNTTTVTNCPNFTYVESDYNGGIFNLVTNTGVPKPAGFSNSQVGIESWAFNPASITIDAGSVMFAEGCGNFSGTITALHGSLELDQCVAYGNITVASDGVLTFAGVTNFGTITNIAGGTFAQTGDFYARAAMVPICSEVRQVAHGFTVGQAVYNTGSVWALAESNAIGTLGIGVVIVSSTDHFIVCFEGPVTGLSGLTAGQYYFVSDATAGLLTSTEPVSTTSFSNPLLFAVTTTTGVVISSRPSSIGATSSPVVVNTSIGVTAAAGQYIFANTGGGGFTVTLPAASANTGLSITVKKVSTDGNTVTIGRTGSDLIDGQTSQAFTAPYTSVTFVSDGSSNWFVT
jgi:hypothetical protein